MKNRDESIGGLMMLKLFMRKWQQFLFLLPSSGSNLNDIVFHEEMEAAKMVPGDVKKGHFAVTAVNGGESKSFIVELGHLTNPEFLRLLEQAKDEYGFQQKGVLAVPCQPEELEKTLEDKRKRRASTEW